jgi:hypothetical protein
VSKIRSQFCIVGNHCLAAPRTKAGKLKYILRNKKLARIMLSSTMLYDPKEVKL